MGVMDKFLNIMKLNPNDDMDDYYDDEDYAEEDEVEVPAKKNSFKTRDVEILEERAAKKAVQPKVTPMQQNSGRGKVQSQSGMEVCVIKPTSVDEAREITETLLAGRTVVLNLEGLDVDIAQRIIDFTSGSCFAIGGNLQKISHYIFIITPSSVDIFGDFQDILGGAFDAGPIDSGM